MRGTINREVVREEVERLLSKKKDIYPTPKRISRAFRRMNVMISDEIIRDSVEKGMLEELQVKRIKSWTKKKFLFEFKSSTFTRVPEKVDEAISEKLEEIVREAVRKDKGDFKSIVELGFSPSTWRKIFRRIPALDDFVREEGMNKEEFLKMVHMTYVPQMKMDDN